VASREGTGLDGGKWQESQRHFLVTGESGPGPVLTLVAPVHTIKNSESGVVYRK